MPLEPQEIQKMAQSEFDEELRRERIEEYKKTLRLRRNFWIRLFPWRIRVERRDVPTLSKDRQIKWHMTQLDSLGVNIYSYAYDYNQLFNPKRGIFP